MRVSNRYVLFVSSIDASGSTRDHHSIVVIVLVRNFQETSKNVFENEHSVESRSKGIIANVHKRHCVEVYSPR